MPIQQPAGYYDRFNNSAKQWKRILFRAGFPLQSAELNELQSMSSKQFENLARSFLKEGTFTEGGNISIERAVSGLDISITAGKLYASGYIHDIEAGQITITGSGLEIVGLLISNQVVTESTDPDLLDPAIGAENYGQPSAHRLQFTYTYVLNDLNAVAVATFLDGQLVTSNTGNALFDLIMRILAQRTNEQSGSFLAELPLLTLTDPSDDNQFPSAQIHLDIENGIGYVQGWRVQNTRSYLSLDRALTGAERLSETQPYTTAVKTYTAANPTILEITDLMCTTQSPSFQLPRGEIGGGQDLIPAQYQPASSIVSISDVPHGAYAEGTDYVLSGNYISWAPTGAEPASGTSYDVILRYTAHLQKAIRTYTHVSAEVFSKSGVATDNLAHPEISRIIHVEDQNAVVYVEGVNFTVDYANGVITWTSNPPAQGVDVTINYYWWARTTLGDFLCRDSFRDSAGNVLFELSPNYVPVDNSVINYKTQMTFGVAGTSGLHPVKPVNGTPFYLTYQYALGRYDVLVWTRDGLFSVVEGAPAVFPMVPSLAVDQLPVAKFYLSPESFASGVVVEYYNNQTLKVVDLRTMLNEIHKLAYNQTMFQLQQDTINMPTATDKRGIFADALATPDLADVTNTDFAASFDFLSRTVQLPRLKESVDLTVNSGSTTAVLKEDVWFSPYTESAAITQPYSSEYTQINALELVNLEAKIVLNPKEDVFVNDNLINVITTIGGSTPLTPEQLVQQMLGQNLSPSTWTAQVTGEGSGTEENLGVFNIPIDPEWKDVLATNPSTQQIGVINANDWSTVLANAQVVIAPYAKIRSVAITGSRFIPNERNIIALFNRTPVALTATGGTQADTAPGSVKADANGDWTATFTIPDGTLTGVYLVEIFGHTPVDITQVGSYATENYSAGGYIRNMTLLISEACPPVKKNASKQVRCAFIVAAALGMQPEKLMLSAKSTADILAAAVVQATKNGVTLNQSLITAAVLGLFDTFDKLQVPTDVSDDVISVTTSFLGTTNQKAISTAIKAITYQGKVYKQLGKSTASFTSFKIDPLAQTFALDVDGFITSIDLYFQHAPDEPVYVAIASTNAGVPTEEYLSVCAKDPEDISTSGATKFTFDKPVFAHGGIEYAIVVLTEDPLATLWIARLGETDPVNGLITKNPAAGVMLRSPNRTTWESEAIADIKFVLNVADFTSEQGILTFDQVTFDDPRSRFAFNCPFAEPNDETRVTFQYSLNGTLWVDFQPLKEVDLGNITSNLYLRVLMDGTDSLCPTVLASQALEGYIWDRTNAATKGYVHRAFTLPSEEVRYVDVWLEVHRPPSCTISVEVDFDDAEGWHSCTDVVADDQQIDQQFWQKHYTYDAGAVNLKDSVRTKVLFNAPEGGYLTPRIRKYRVIARGV